MRHQKVEFEIRPRFFPVEGFLFQKIETDSGIKKRVCLIFQFAWAANKGCPPTHTLTHTLTHVRFPGN